MQSRERSKNYQEQKRATTADEFTDEMSVSPTSSFQSRMAKKRALDQTKNVLLQTPEKKVEIVENLVKSPQRRKALQKKGVVKSPEEEKGTEVLRALVSDLSGAIEVLKHEKKKRGSRAAFSAMKSLAFGETVKKKRLVSSVSKLVLLDRRSVSWG